MSKKQQQKKYKIFLVIVIKRDENVRGKRSENLQCLFEAE
jgi:hypothetical protein